MPVVFAVAHLAVAAAWLGSMLYSLTVVQPKVAAYFDSDARREEFLLTLAHGNRRKVLALVTVLLLTALAVIATTPPRVVAIGYGVALVLYLCAAAIFGNVSWRHWPARVFARPEELPGYRTRLTYQALTMLGLVGAAFLVALAVSVGAGVG